MRSAFFLGAVLSLSGCLDFQWPGDSVTDGGMQGDGGSQSGGGTQSGGGDAGPTSTLSFNKTFYSATPDAGSLVLKFDGGASTVEVIWQQASSRTRVLHDAGVALRNGSNSIPSPDIPGHYRVRIHDGTRVHWLDVTITASSREFEGRGNFSADDSPRVTYGMASSDFNGDNKPDLVYVNSKGLVIKDLPDGGSNEIKGFSEPVSPVDWDQDGTAELMTLDGKKLKLRQTDGGTLFEGNAESAGNVEGGASAMLFPDLDNDGYPEVVYDYGDAGTVFYAMRAASGSVGFRTYRVGSAYSFLSAWSLGDFDNDGDEDLIVSARPTKVSNVDTLFVLVSDGKGVLSGHKQLSSTDNKVRLNVGENCVMDLDGDGFRDISTTSIWNDPGHDSATTFYGKGANPSITSRAVLVLSNDFDSNSVMPGACADLDGNGLPENAAFTQNRGYKNGHKYMMKVIQFGSNSTPSVVQYTGSRVTDDYQTGYYPSFGDFNGDGRLDVAGYGSKEGYFDFWYGQPPTP